MHSDENWADKAKFMKRVGSFVAPSWVSRFDGIEGPVDSCLVEEEESEEIEFSDGYRIVDGDDDGDEGSEDYSEEEEDEDEDEEGEDQYSDTDGKGEGSDEEFSDEEEEMS